jgi:hypothetical protein
MRATTATYDDANLILRLYELRREERMRAARQWFSRNVKGITGMADIARLCPPGTDEDASIRMVTSYWDMVASFLTGGVLNRELFYASGRELLLVWVRIEPAIPDLRAMLGSGAFRNLEEAATGYREWMDKQSPGSFEVWKKSVS